MNSSRIRSKSKIIFDQVLIQIQNSKLTLGDAFPNSSPTGRLIDFGKEKKTKIRKYKDWEPINALYDYESVKRYKSLINIISLGIHNLPKPNKETKFEYEDLYSFSGDRYLQRYIEEFEHQPESAHSLFSRISLGQCGPKYFVLNDKKESIDAFSVHLKKLSQKLIKSSQELAINAKMFFVGTQGVGKTTLLNYLFATKDEYFTKNRIIWLRLDFNPRHNRPPISNSSGIDDLIYQKLLKIFFEYHNGNDDLKVEKSEFEAFLSEDENNRSYKFTDERRKELLAQVDDLFSYCPGENIYYHKRLLIEFTRYLQKKGIGIIVSIDGLDRTSLGKYDTESWKHFTNDIQKTFFRPEDPIDKIVLILSLRDCSYSYIRDQNFNQFSTQAHPVCYVLPGLLDEVIPNKYKIIRKKVYEHYREKVDPVSSLFDDNFLTFFYKIIARLSKEALDIDTHEELLKISGNNYRAMFRCYSKLVKLFGLFIIDHLIKYKDQYMNFEEELLYRCRKYFYIAIRAYVMAGEVKEDYQSNYKYSFRNGQLIFEPKSNTARALLPNLFNYINISDSLNPDSKWFIKDNKVCSKNLLKIRVIQILTQRRTINFNDLFSFLSFFYKDTPFILAELEELIKENIIRVVGLRRIAFRGDFVSMFYSGENLLDLNAANLKITFMGQYLYSQIVTRFMYLLYIVNDTPMPTYLISLMNRTNIFNEQSFVSYAKSIVNVLLFVEKFLKNLEIEELNRITTLLDTENEAQHYFEYFKIIQTEKSLYDRIINSLREELPEKIGTTLRFTNNENTIERIEEEFQKFLSPIKNYNL